MAPVSLKRAPAPQVLQSFPRVQAPLGMNTVAPAGALPDGRALSIWNMLGSEYGLRSRLGFEEWVTGLGAQARSVIGFTGSRKNGSTDALFAATPFGIYQCTTPTTSPSVLVSFANTTGDAGYGVSAIVATPAGRFLLHCDEENGLYIYPESGAWTQGHAGATVPWAPATVYANGDKVVNGPNTYVVTAAGTSAGSGGPTGTGTGITDNSVTWNFLATFSATAIGTSLADQHNGFSALPANFAAITTWKNRVWLVEKDTSRAWYSGLNAVYGTYTSFDFGSKMQHGGPLTSLFNWAYDGGNGMDTRLVGVSTAGDIVVYQGTDPSSANTFGLAGNWFVGGVPYGRRIATDYGADVLVLTAQGVLPLSKLVIGNPVVSRSVYTTAEISNLFTLLLSSAGTLPGWSLQLHPADNALLITIPQTSAGAIQLVYSFATQGWSRYRDLPMLSGGVWNGELYFGTSDGRLCKNTGYVDNVLLNNASAYTPVQWSLLTGYTNGGNAQNKKVQLVRPTVLSETPAPIVQATPRYNYDLSDPAPPTSSVAGNGAATWDSAIWDSSLWGGDYTPSQPLSGGLGMGRDVALSVQGSAVSRTIFTGADILFETGGFL